MNEKLISEQALGKMFHELSNEEMAEIVGGNNVDTKITPGVSAISKSLVALSKWSCISAVSGLLSYRHC